MVTSPMFKVAQNRKIKFRNYRIYELDQVIPIYYKKLIQTTKNFSSPVMRDSIRNIHRIVNEMNMPYKDRKRAMKLLRANKRILLMTTREVCASSTVGLAILTLGLRKKYCLYTIAKVLGCSASSISARIFKVVESRGTSCSKYSYKISVLEKDLPKRWRLLLGRL